jgi:hypothetical protein
VATQGSVSPFPPPFPLPPPLFCAVVVVAAEVAGAELELAGAW